jgi:2-haloacid dehalogenase
MAERRRATTLVFDVMGTVVDMEGSIAAQATTVLAASGVPGDQITGLLADWEGRLERHMDAVRAGRSPWASHGELRRAALDAALAEAGVGDLPPAVVETLATVIHRLDAWPDSVEALAVLRRSRTVVALSNADLDELSDLSAGAGLAWHAVLSAQFAQSFKPDPAVYGLATDLLGADPEQIMLVAAHPWDLRGAAACGFGTAYIGRPGAERPTADDAFDVEADDLGDLARQLTN